MLIKSSLILETSVTFWERTLQLLLVHQVHGAGAQQHGTASTDVSLVRFQHYIGASSIPEHNLAGKSLNQDLRYVLSVSPGY